MPDPWRYVEAAVSICFILCLVPQFFWTVKRGRSRDVSLTFLLLVLLASVLGVAYTSHTLQWWLSASFGANLVVWGTVLYYRLRPRPGTVPANPETY